MSLTASHFLNRNKAFFEKCPLCQEEVTVIENETDDFIGFAANCNKHACTLEISINYAKFYLITIQSPKYNIMFDMYQKEITVSTNVDLGSYITLNVEFDTFPFREYTDEELASYMVFA